MNLLKNDFWLNLAALCLLLACAETLHGIFRTVVLARWWGKERALKASLFSGCALATALCAWRVPELGLHATSELLAVGLALAGFMAAFDISLARWLLRRAWPKIWQDFNPGSGNWLMWGLCWLTLAPWLVMRWQAGV